MGNNHKAELRQTQNQLKDALQSLGKNDAKMRLLFNKLKEVEAANASFTLKLEQKTDALNSATANLEAADSGTRTQIKRNNTNPNYSQFHPTVTSSPKSSGAPTLRPNFGKKLIIEASTSEAFQRDTLQASTLKRKPAKPTIDNAEDESGDSGINDSTAMSPQAKSINSLAQCRTKCQPRQNLHSKVCLPTMCRAATIRK